MEKISKEIKAKNFPCLIKSYKPTDPRSLINLDMKKCNCFCCILLHRFWEKLQDCGCQFHLPTYLSWVELCTPPKICWISNTHYLWIWTYLETRSFRYIQVMMKSYSIRIGPKSIWLVSLQKDKTETQTEMHRMNAMWRQRKGLE